MPMIKAVIIEVRTEKHLQGVRGVGEVPIVPPLAAVANAIRTAAGLRLTKLPMPPAEDGGGGHDSHKLTAELINDRCMMYC
jgi:CO/xanthine dehydrogenase Mo-binding subunit